jgi:hypothetical protein
MPAMLRTEIQWKGMYAQGGFLRLQHVTIKHYVCGALLRKVPKTVVGRFTVPSSRVYHQSGQDNTIGDDVPLGILSQRLIIFGN